MKVLRALSIGILCSAITIFTVFAHPGSTDSDGGHRNHSTGEYHYHHGYSAHEHYDMNGDSKNDCPYIFDDEANSGIAHNSIVSNAFPNSQSKSIFDQFEDFFCDHVVLLFIIQAILSLGSFALFIFGLRRSNWKLIVGTVLGIASILMEFVF